MTSLSARCHWLPAAFISLFLGNLACAAAITVTDDRGEQVGIDAPARRIITLAPSLTELVYAAGAGDALIGVARFSDFPPAARSIAQMGDASRIDLERVVSLKPDLVIAWKTGNHAADYERLRSLGMTVFVAEPATLIAIARLVRAVGTLAGTLTVAEPAAAEFERGIAALAAQYRSQAEVRVFYEIWHQPLMTVSGRHLISDVIALCGGRNVFAAAPTLTPVVSLESVIAAAPQVVLGGSSATTPAEFAAPWALASRYAGLAKIRALYVDPDYIQRQTPRVLEGARTVCRHLESVRAAAR